MDSFYFLKNIQVYIKGALKHIQGFIQDRHLSMLPQISQDNATVRAHVQELNEGSCYLKYIVLLCFFLC